MKSRIHNNMMHSNMMKRISVVFIFMILATFFARGKSNDSIVLVNTKILLDYKKVEAGKPLLAQTEIILIKEVYDNKPIDMHIEYIITDSRGNAVMKISETKGIIDRLSMVKELMLPSDIPPGAYTLAVTAAFKEKSGAETVSFEVIKTKSLPSPSFFTNKGIIVLLTILLMIFTIFFIALYYEHRKIKNLERKGYRRI